MLDLSNICCICLDRDIKLTKLHENPADNKKYLDKIRFIIPEIIFPELYEQISFCDKCKVRIDELYSFRELCLRNNQTFNEYITNLKSLGKNLNGISIKLVDLKKGDGGENEDEKKSSISFYSFDCSGLLKSSIGGEVKCEEELDISDEDIQGSESGSFEAAMEPEAGSAEKKCESVTITRINSVLSTNANESTSDVEQDNIPNNESSPLEISPIAPELIAPDFIKTEIPEDNEDSSFPQENDSIDYTHDFPSLFQFKPQNKNLPPGKKLLACSICNETFTRPTHLRTHRRIHEGKTIYACEYCGKPFSHVSTMKQHEKFHLAERPYSCDICHRKFTEASFLNKHKRSHSDERPYTCELCNKSFKDLWHLKKHGRTHSDERLFQCQICSKFFKDACNLKRHQKLHTGEKAYVCKICNRSFNEQTTLKVHTRLHTNERPYACDLCDKSFKQLCSLQAHRRIHTGETPYSCGECNKSFKQLSSLKAHQRSHTHLDNCPF